MAKETVNSNMDKLSPSQEKSDSFPSREKKRSLKYSKIKRRIFKHVWLVRLGMISIFLVFVSLIVIATSFVFNKVGITPKLQLVSSFLFTPESKIKSAGGRTNVLVLGRAGTNHDAPDLTDTIMFTSFAHKKVGISTVSLPRDIWIPALRAKLNSAYFWGEQKETSGGIILAKASVEEIVGQPVHYAVTVDFEGFIKIVEVIDGVEVNVENSFSDERYPISGLEDDDCDGDPKFDCRYEIIFFEKGVQTMNAETALKFVRSRNAEGDEGTDLARNQRQQKILMAIKNKLLTPSVLLSPKKLLSILAVINESIDTDIKDDAVAILARRAFQSRNSVSTNVLPEGLLFHPPKSARYDNLYVFVPTGGNWESVHEWINNLLTK